MKEIINILTQEDISKLLQEIKSGSDDACRILLGMSRDQVKDEWISKFQILDFFIYSEDGSYSMESSEEGDFSIDWGNIYEDAWHSLYYKQRRAAEKT